MKLVGYIILCIGMVGCGVILGLSSHTEETKSLPVKQDTIISKMHYIIWTEPDGDMWVVNATLDSLKTIMFQKQTQ